jgi:lysophospholipase L1-like esterase
VKELSQAGDQLAYVDTATPLLGADGHPRPDLFLDDGLHLNEKGYALWTATLQPILQNAAHDE